MLPLDDIFLFSAKNIIIKKKEILFYKSLYNLKSRQLFGNLHNYFIVIK